MHRSLEKGGLLSADDIREVNEFLLELPPGYEPLVNKLRARL
jgi:hypothetical protein